MRINANILLKPFKPFIERTGASFVQVCHLVDLKLLLDNRKTSPTSSGKKQDPKNTLMRQSLMFILVGVFFSLMLLQVKNPFIFAFATQTYIGVMVAITMMAEYSVSLFDTRDNNLILPLPVNGQTLGWARVLHILLFLLLLAFSLALPSVVVIGFLFGITTSALFFLATLLNTIFTLFLTIFIYLGLMKFTSGDRLKDIMMYIQVGLSVIIMIGYQMVPRFITSEGGGEIALQIKWYFLLIPPAWFAMLSTFTSLQGLIATTGTVVALVLPILGMIFIGKKLFFGFDSTLSQLSAGDASNSKVKSEKTKNGETIWFKTTALILAIANKEKPLYKLMWKMVGRERLFKQSLLPMLAYMVVIPMFLIFSKQQEWGSIAIKYPIFLYFTILTSSMIPAILCIGNNSETGWIYRILPNLQPSAIFSAAAKAAMGRYFLPVYMALSAPLFYFKGIAAVSDIITIFLFNYLLIKALLYYQSPLLPFTQTKAASQGGKTALRMMLIMFVALPFGFLHSFLSKQNEWFPLLLCLVFIPLIILFERKWYPHKVTWNLVDTLNKL